MKHYVLIKDNEILQHYNAEIKPSIHINKGIIYEYIEEAAPVPLSTQKVEEGYEVQGDKYVQVFTIVDKTEYEIAIEGWHFPEYPYKLRIKVDLSLLSDQQVQQFVSMLVLWWSAKKDELDHTSDSQYLYFYCDNILPEHNQIIAAMQGVIVVENRPKE